MMSHTFETPIDDRKETVKTFFRKHNGVNIDLYKEKSRKIIDISLF